MTDTMNLQRAVSHENNTMLTARKIRRYSRSVLVEPRCTRYESSMCAAPCREAPIKNTLEAPYL
jgi:hypothetical protein